MYVSWLNYRLYYKEIKKKKIKRNWKDWWKSNLWFFFGKLLLSLHHIYSIVMNCMRSLSFINI